MKNVIYLILLSCMGLFIVSCAEKTSDSQKHEQHDKHSHGDHKGHDHGDHKGHNHPDGPEYTSNYICPMYCDGSGSAKPGICPVCGMDYVINRHKH